MNFKVTSRSGVETHFRHASAAYAYWLTQAFSGAKIYSFSGRGWYQW